MKILFVTDTYFPHINGVYYFIEQLASHLQNRGHDVAVIAPSASVHFTSTKINNIIVYGMPSLSVLMYRSVRFPIPFLLRKKINRIVNNYEPDIIHLQGHFALSKSIFKVNKKYNIPVIATNHFMPENLTCFLSSERLKRKVEVWLWKGFAEIFNKALLVTTPTETAVGLIRPKLNVPVRAVSNGIDLKKFSAEVYVGDIREKFGIPNKPILLSVGRLDPEKHLAEVIAAAGKALNNSDFCLVIAGKGVMRDTLERQAKKSGTENNIIFTGFVSNEDLPQLYKISSCFITASIAELQSLATMEAMASGLPVIAANAGALGELVHNGKNGYLFSNGDIDCIARSICAVINDTFLNENMRKKSLEYIAAHDINVSVEIYECLYKKYCRSLIPPLKNYELLPALINEVAT